MTNRNAVLLFLHRTSSVLFPPNKYQIKFIPFFRPFQSGVRCLLLCTACICPCCLQFCSRGEGWEPVTDWAEAGSSVAMQALLTASLLFRPPLGPVPAPSCCVLTRCCTR